MQIGNGRMNQSYHWVTKWVTKWVIQTLIISQPHSSVSINYRQGSTGNPYLRSIGAPNKGFRG